MNNNTNTNQNNMETQNPQVPETKTTNVPEQANDIKESEVVDMDASDSEAPKGDASDITFDYNEIYGVTESETSDKPDDMENLPVFDEKEIVIDENKLKKETDDVVPEFRIDELEGNSATKSESNKSLDEIMDDKEADKADTRRKIAYILVIAAILIIFVWFIFPIMAGYNL